MNLHVLNSVWDRGGIAVELLSDCSGVLLLLAAAFFVFRTFRERFLLAWIAGWSAFLVYRVATVSESLIEVPRWLPALGQGAFVCAVTLFVIAIVCYTGAYRLCSAIGIAGAVVAAIAAARAMWWPESLWWLTAVRLGCLILSAIGCVKLGIFSRGRRQVGPWVLMAMLLLVHLDINADSAHSVAGVDAGIELLLGVSMLVIVLDDSRQRADRLASMNVISTTIGGAQDHSAMVLTALEELKKLTGAKAAWFRLLEGNELVLVGHSGLSEEFIRSRSTVDIRTVDGARAIQQGEPLAIRHDVLEAGNQQLVRDEGFDHILLVPVRGKTAVIGSVMLGQAHKRSYPAEELKFLAAAAHQIGIAVENLRLLEEIIHSHRQWISTFDSIEDMVLVHDAEFRIIKLNRSVAKRLSTDAAAVVFQPCEKVLPGGGSTWQNCPYCEPQASNFVERPDPCFGGHSLVSTSRFTEGGVYHGTIHVIRDTTERRAAEQRYRMLFEQVQEGVFVSTPEGKILECNNAFVQMLGYSSVEEVLALDIARDMYGSSALRDAFVTVMNQHGFVHNYEVDIRRKDGTIVHTMENSFATRDESGRVEKYQGFLLDITEKRRAEDQIRRRNRELHALNAIAVTTAQSFDLDEILNTGLRHLIDIFAVDTGAVYLMGKDNVLRRVAAHGQRNDSDNTQIALPPEFLRYLRELRVEVMTHEDLAQIPDVLRDYVRSEGLRHWIWVVMWTNNVAVGVIAIGGRSEREFKASDQHLMVAVARQLATTVEKVRLYEETCRAYDNLRETQEQLLQSEKMSAIGQLISGVAHEINNPLTAILGYAQLLEHEDIGERGHDFVKKLFKQAQRTQRLVHNLLSFSRQRKPEKKQISIRQVIEETLALREFDFSRREFKVKRQIAEHLPTVTCDAHQLEQVFLNIINNAFDAMLDVGQGGTLTVRAYEENGRVCVDFHDTGLGIREPKKVFDPFYTTKGVGKGTGLGLSICYGIIKEHGGDIFAMNHPDGGAMFRIMLPAGATAAVETPVERPAQLPRLQGRVLIVDDEEAVLEFEREALTGAGAEVVAVSSREQAIERLEREKFDAVLLDAELAGNVRGVDLYRWIKTNLPDAEANIILTVSDIREMESGLHEANVPCIAKPFQVAELISAARSVLAKRRAVVVGK